MFAVNVLINSEAKGYLNNFGNFETEVGGTEIFESLRKIEDHFRVLCATHPSANIEFLIYNVGPIEWYLVARPALRFARAEEARGASLIYASLIGKTSEIECVSGPTSLHSTLTREIK
jgi:hypothetical protein